MVWRRQSGAFAEMGASQRDGVNIAFTVAPQCGAMRGSGNRPRGTMTALILIVDDDPIQRRLLEAMARRFGYDAECVESGEAALTRLEASDRPPINLLILDLVMPDLDGMGVLARMRQRDLAVPPIVQAAHGWTEVVTPAMRAGATDFVVKPVGAERLQVSIRNALRVDALEDEVRRLNKQASGPLGFKALASRAE